MRDDTFWELGMAPKKKKDADQRPRAYDVTAVDITVDVQESESAANGRIPPRSAQEKQAPPREAQEASPPRTEDASPRPIRASSRFVEVTGEEGAQKKTDAENSARPPVGERKGTYPDSPLRRYRPRVGMIRQVEIFHWPSSYGFYAQFRRDAARYYPIKGKPCPRASFFSYIPQYSQMTAAQMNYYLYFRQCIREGHYPETVDFSYVLLYVYEILNLPDCIPPKEGMRALCDVWLAYRKLYPKLDKYMAEWICDYGLTYGLPCPIQRLSAIKDICLENCSLREYYIAEDDLAVVLAEYGSHHTFRKTKYAKGEYAPIFEKHVPLALAHTIDAAARDGLDLFSFEDMRLYRAERDVFSGALCAHSVKRRVVVSYLSLGRSHEMRQTVTAVVKYIENGIRSHLRIRSMLSVGALAPELKAYVDEYLRATFGVSEVGARQRHAPVRADYEKLYDVPTSDLSPARARQIEQDSWASTDVLTSAFSDADTEEDSVSVAEAAASVPQAAPAAAQAVPVAEDDPYRCLLDALTDGERRVLLGCLDGSSVADICRREGLLADAVVAAINEKAADLTGDIIIEPDGASYSVVEDYREELAACRTNN